MAWERAEVVVAWTPCTGRQPSPRSAGAPVSCWIWGELRCWGFPRRGGGEAGLTDPLTSLAL